MSELGSSYVRIRPDLAGFRSDVDATVDPATRERTVHIRADTDPAKRDVAYLRGDIDTLDKTVTVRVRETGAQQATHSIGLLGAALAATIPLTAPLGAVLATGLAAVSSAAVAGVAGIGAFALVAKTAASNVSDAAKALDAYSKTTDKIQATEQYAIDHAKNHAAVLAAQATAAKQTAAAQETLNQATAQFSPAQVDAARALESFQRSWRTFASQFDPLIFRIMGDGLAIAQAHLGVLTPLVQATGTELLRMENGIRAAFGSSYWQTFISMIQRDAAPVLHDFVTVLGNLVTGFAGILMAFEPMSRTVGQGIVDLTAKFAAWGANLGATSGFQHFIDYVRREGPVVGQTLRNIGQALVEIAPVLARVGHVEMTGLSLFSRLIADIAGVINSLPGPMQEFAVAVAAAALAYSKLAPLLTAASVLVLGRKVETVAANEAVAASYRSIAIAAGDAAVAETAASGAGAGGILGKLGAGRAGGLLGALRGAVGGIGGLGAVGTAGAIVGGAVAAGAGVAALTAPAAAARIDAARTTAINTASAIDPTDITAIQNAQEHLAELNKTMAAYLHYKATGVGPPITIPPDFRVRLGEARTEVAHLASNTAIANVTAELFASDLRKVGVAAKDTAGDERNHAQSVAAVRSAVTDAAGALRQHVQVLLATGTSTSTANRIAVGWAQQLEVQAAKTLGSKAAADKLLASLHLLPRQVQTDVTLGGISLAERQIDALMAKIAGIPRSVATTIVLHPDTSLADQALMRYQSGLAQPPHHAVGGFAPLGTSSIVGEQGPELRVETPTGAMYYPTSSAQTQAALSGRSGGSTFIAETHNYNRPMADRDITMALRRLDLVHGGA